MSGSGEHKMEPVYKAALGLPLTAPVLTAINYFTQAAGIPDTPHRLEASALMGLATAMMAAGATFVFGDLAGMEGSLGLVGSSVKLSNSFFDRNQKRVDQFALAVGLAAGFAAGGALQVFVGPELVRDTLKDTRHTALIDQETSPERPFVSSTGATLRKDADGNFIVQLPAKKAPSPKPL